MPTNEQILQALKTAPPLVKEAFGSNRTAEAVSRVRDRYGLHIDIIGQISKEVGYLLLGFMDPVSFLESLVSKGIDRESAKSIVSDLNQEIFLPLQQNMKNGVTPLDDAEDEEEVTHNEAVAYRTPPTHVSVPVPAIEQIQMPTQQPGPRTEVATQTYSAPTPEPAYQSQPPLVQNGSVILPGTMPPTPHPWQTSPARSFQTASVPYTSVPYVSQPIESKSAPQQTYPTSGITPPQPVQPAPGYIPPAPRPPAQAPTNPLSREYAVDPYREPIQ